MFILAKASRLGRIKSRRQKDAPGASAIGLTQGRRKRLAWPRSSIFPLFMH